MKELISKLNALLRLLNNESPKMQALFKQKIHGVVKLIVSTTQLIVDKTNLLNEKKISLSLEDTHVLFNFDTESTVSMSSESDEDNAFNKFKDDSHPLLSSCDDESIFEFSSDEESQSWENKVGSPVSELSFFKPNNATIKAEDKERLLKEIKKLYCEISTLESDLDAYASNIELEMQAPLRYLALLEKERTYNAMRYHT